MQTHLYQLGPNLLMNGDSTDAEQVRHLYETYQSIGGDKVELCLTDPPYGVALGRVYGDLRPFNTLPIANDNLPDDILTEFLVQSIGNIQTSSKSPKILLFFGFLKFQPVSDALKRLNQPIKGVLIWIKQHFVASFAEFSFQAEGIIYCGKSDAIHRNKNRCQSNLFFCKQPSLTKTTPWYHPTSKPVELLRDLLDATTIVGDTVIDPFAGTGSSLVACHRTGRKWLGIELEPRYCLATCMRFRYETANQVPVYEILPDGERIELSDAELKSRFDAACQEQSKAKQTANKGGNHA